MPAAPARLEADPSWRASVASGRRFPATSRCRRQEVVPWSSASPKRSPWSDALPGGVAKAPSPRKNSAVLPESFGAFDQTFENRPIAGS
jgi:hypothetical protein